MATYEFQDFDIVQEKTNSLREIFADYSATLAKLNSTITSSFNTGDDSALESSNAQDFLNDWNDSAEAFNNLKTLFENLSAAVDETMANNLAYNSTTEALTKELDHIDEPNGEQGATVKTYSEDVIEERMSSTDQSAAYGPASGIGDSVVSNSRDDGAK
jgi:hypothetical protein